jgi:hypothetical protein
MSQNKREVLFSLDALNLREFLELILIAKWQAKYYRVIKIYPHYT